MRFRFVLLAAAAVAAAPSPSAQADREPRPSADAEVRVLLTAASGPRAVRIEGPAEVRADGAVVGRLAAGERAEATSAGGRVRLRAAGLSADGARVEVVPDEAARVGEGRAARVYRGRLALRAARGGVEVVNHVALADYVPSVVASELGFPELEAAKAQAVLARTYALRRAARAEPGAAYDLDDTERSQVYRGQATVTPTARRAADETHGEVLTHDGQLIEAVYSSSSGGHTADNDAVWLTRAVPYLRGVADPFDAIAPDHAWTTTAPAAAVHAALSRRYGGQVTHVEVAERSREGRAVRMRLVGARTELASANDVRATINAAVGGRTVRSTNVRLERAGDVYRFEGRGFGHGVGMSQYGALGQARAGRSHADILRFYFGGTRLERLPGSRLGDDLDPWAAPAVAGVPERPGVRPTRRTSGAWTGTPIPSAEPIPPAASPSAAPVRNRGEALVVPREPAPQAAPPPAAPRAEPADAPRTRPTPRRAAW